MEERQTARKGQVDEKDAQLLKTFPFFQKLEDRHLQKFLEDAIIIQYNAAQTIIRRGEVANYFFVILNGRINIGITSDHKFIPVQTLKTGNILGWSWLIPPHHWRFDAIALERTRMLMVDGTRIRDLCEQNHDFGYELMKRVATVLAGRLESTRLDLLGRPPKSY